ncbi:hypothetical protein VIAE108258_21380 [Vibrio aerogenes]
MIGDDVVQTLAAGVVVGGDLRQRTEGVWLVEIFGALQGCAVGGDLALLNHRVAIPQVMRLSLGFEAFFGDSSPERVVAIAVTGAVRQLNMR